MKTFLFHWKRFITKHRFFLDKLTGLWTIMFAIQALMWLFFGVLETAWLNMILALVCMWLNILVRKRLVEPEEDEVRPEYWDGFN